MRLEQSVSAGQPAAKPSVAMDREVIASAVVLREVHCALLRAVEGSALTPAGTAPHAAQLLVPPEAHASQAQWCERVANAVLSAAEPVEPEAWVRSSPALPSPTRPSPTLFAWLWSCPRLAKRLEAHCLRCESAPA